MTFDRLGVVLLLCNIHENMSVYILVLQNPFFATVGADGKFAIESVPDGSYTLTLWTEGKPPQSKKIVIKGETVAGIWMLLLLAAVAAGASATWTVGARIVRQVSSMANAIGEITAKDDLERRLPVGSADELGSLALAFNSLLAAQQTFARERAGTRHHLHAAFPRAARMI